jgi:hypothetical protein
MQQNMPKLGTVLMVAVIIAWVGVWVPPAVAKPALVEVTGQTECFDTSGNLIDCSSAAGTGQDGDIQAGVPFPTPRFIDRGNGTVKDNLTNLIRLKNANCSTINPANWATALSNANSLANGQCGLSDGSVAGDWRLPNVKELQSLIDFGFSNPALSNAAGTAKWTEGNTFSGVLSTPYWSSTTARTPRSARGTSTWSPAAPSAATSSSSTVCGRCGGEENRFFDTLRLWTLWGVQAGFPPATPHFLAEGHGHDPLPEAAHAVP